MGEVPLGSGVAVGRAGVVGWEAAGSFQLQLVAEHTVRGMACPQGLCRVVHCNPSAASPPSGKCEVAEAAEQARRQECRAVSIPLPLGLGELLRVPNCFTLRSLKRSWGCGAAREGAQ